MNKQEALEFLSGIFPAKANVTNTILKKADRGNIYSCIGAMTIDKPFKKHGHNLNKYSEKITNENLFFTWGNHTGTVHVMSENNDETIGIIIAAYEDENYAQPAYIMDVKEPTTIYFKVVDNEFN